MTYHLSCHCGATRIEVDRLPESVTSCNCSFCGKRGALWGYYDPEEVRITVTGADALYSPVSSKHHFCPTCGCTTYSLTANWEGQLMRGEAPKEDSRLSLNLRLLDDAEIETLAIEKVDGRNGW